MEIKDIAWKYYQLLSDEDRALLVEAVETEKTDEISVDGWKWGDVKMVQDLFSQPENITMGDVLDIARLDGARLNQWSSSKLVLQFYKKVRKAIEQISKIEADTLGGSEDDAKISSALEQVGGFSEFGSLTQTLALVGVLAPSVEQVNAMRYDVCYAALLYQKKENQFKKILYKS